MVSIFGIDIPIMELFVFIMILGIIMLIESIVLVILLLRLYKHKKAENRG